MSDENTFKLYEKIPDLPQIPSFPYSSLCLTNREADEWQFLFKEIENIPSPYSKNQDFDFSTVSPDVWQPVFAPCSLIMQGFDIQNNKEYYYKKNLTIPDDYKNKKHSFKV